MDDSKDFGTPSVNSEKLVTLNIDGVDVTVHEGTSLMRAASVAGFSVPK
jgi:formate dehydrogenase major subunit